MSLPVPIKVPHEDKAQRQPQHPLLPPDDPNVDRIDRAPDIDPPPTDPPVAEPEQIEEPARAWAMGSDAYPEWMRVGVWMPTSPCALRTSLGAA